MRHNPLIQALLNKCQRILGRLFYLTGLFFYPEMITPPIFADTVKNYFDNKKYKYEDKNSRKLRSRFIERCLRGSYGVHT